MEYRSVGVLVLYDSVVGLRDGEMLGRASARPPTAMRYAAISN